MDRRSFCHQLLGASIAVGSMTTLLKAAPWAKSGAPVSKLRWQTSLKSAQKLALQQDKPMLIVFGASWCTYCHKLERETLADQRVVALIERDFIPVHLDFDKDSKIAKILEVERLPCTVFLSPQADLLHRTEGFANVKEFQSTLSTALDRRSEVQQVRASTANP